MFFSSSSQVLNKTSSQLRSINITELYENNNWRIIDLSHNSIDSVDSPDLLQQQNDLETLQLSFNSNFKGQTTSKLIFAHKTLKNFECGNCGFVEIASQHFTGLPSLKELRLSANKINRINEDAFKSNKQLQLLDLSSNRLTSVPPSTFADLKFFEVLNLSMNNIALPERSPFLKSGSLKRLRLDGCSISSLYAETFSELRTLVEINLNGNKIKSLTVTPFKSNEKLKILLVESNQIKDFSLVTVDFMKQLEEFCIGNNTLDPSSKFVKSYGEMGLSVEKCNHNVEFFTENSSGHNTTEQSAKLGKFINEGISDFFIGSYISIFLILQAVAFVMLSIYLIKITKYEKLDGVNYANTILNDNEIYRLCKREFED